MRLTTRRMLPALLAVLAFSAIAATAAQAATEGPFFKVSGKRLASGESAEVKMTFGGRFAIANQFGHSFECEGMKLKPGAKFLGSSGANSGKFEGAFEFTGCAEYTEEGRHTVCEASKVSTSTLAGTLAYLSESRTGEFRLSIGNAFRSGTVIVEGTCGKLTGGWDLAGFGRTGEPGPDSVGSEMTEVASWRAGQDMFGEQKAWSEASGTIKNAFRWLLLENEGDAKTYPGLAEKIELVNGDKWGIYTKV
jgi:hypothetical protein